MSSQVYWHWPTFIMFICMGLLLVWAYNLERSKANTIGRKMRVFGASYLFVYFVFIIIGVFRLIDSYHGGTDTPGYIYKFLNIFNPIYAEGTDFVFKLINMAVRYFTSDYHIYLFVIYFIMLYSFVKFLNSYSLSWSSSVPLFLISYLYYVGFSSMRSNLAFCLLLIALAFYVRNQYKLAIVLTTCSCLTHISLIMYAPVLLFCYTLKNFDIKLWHIAVAIIIAYGIGLFLQHSFIAGTFAFLDDVGSGAYASYATKSLYRNSIIGFIVVNFPSIIMGITLMLFIEKIKNLIKQLAEYEAFIVKTLLMICIYDVLMVPITYSLGVYRGYMYLMVPRLLMWGIIFIVISRFFLIPKKLVNIVGFVVFLVWIYTRFEAMYESSQLMPYMINFEL